MKQVMICLLILAGILVTSPLLSAVDKDETVKEALLLIDIQDFYFPGGGMPLVNPEAAALNGAKLLKTFRGQKKLIIHVRHNAKAGAGIHRHVKPLEGEKVISKDNVSCFKGSDLLEFLKTRGIKKLVICGMQTHMCVEAAVRAGSDHGFGCILVHDACATRALTFKDRTVSAEDVHASTLSALRAYAKVVDTATFLKGY